VNESLDCWTNRGRAALRRSNGIASSRAEESVTGPIELDGRAQDQVSSIAQPSPPSVLLVTCVKTKQQYPCAAKDLYISPLFKKQRAYAEKSNVSWFILSAEHGLVAPDEWLAPYERYLPDTPADYRAVWATWVAARLDLIVGALRGQVVEIHAGADYLNVLRPEIELRGAIVIDPLKGLSHGQRLAWYGFTVPVETLADVNDQAIVDQLLNRSAAIAPSDFLAAGSTEANLPGLYSWWVDDQGAADVSRGLGLPFESGLIYAGLAGATRWPSGTRSRSTLWLRIATMHLAGSHEFSTFRRTLGALLANASGSTRVNEEQLSEWMRDHLRVVVVPSEDRDELGRLETRVLKMLDPPLNLQGMTSTPVRKRLKLLRNVVTKNN
jgi:hypothetical protein